MALPGTDFSEFKEGRAPASAVAKYYLEYIEKNRLSGNFAPNTTVTMVQPLSSKVSRKLMSFLKRCGYTQ